MAKTTLDKWNSEFLYLSPVFDTIKSNAVYHTGSENWPSLKQLKQQFEDNNHPITPVAQGNKPSKLEDHYEPRIFLKQELQTRTENWHDFFNAMVWLTFRNTKSVLNELHYHAAIKRNSGTNRSALENAITLFDECGLIIISNDDQLLEMIRQHQWKDLFFNNRDRFDKDIFCLVFGHAMYEKALTPYIGMTCQALLINSSELVKCCKNGVIKDIDNHVADYWKNNNITATNDLNAFPLLGIPGLHSENSESSFYDNTDYFRAKKNRT